MNLLALVHKLTCNLPMIKITVFRSSLPLHQIIKVLSAYAADVGVVTKDGHTPLHFAASGGYTDCCRFLAQRGKFMYYK